MVCDLLNISWLSTALKYAVSSNPAHLILRIFEQLWIQKFETQWETTYTISFVIKNSTLVYTLYLTLCGEGFLKQVRLCNGEIDCNVRTGYLSAGCQFWLHHSSSKRSVCSQCSKLLLRASYRPHTPLFKSIRFNTLALRLNVTKLIFTNFGLLSNNKLKFRGHYFKVLLSLFCLLPTFTSHIYTTSARRTTGRNLGTFYRGADKSLARPTSRCILF